MPDRTIMLSAGEASGDLHGGTLCRALYGAYRALLRRIRAQRPDALVLIDFPEFNMRLGRAASRAGVRVVYFVPHQVWAWRPWRARRIARFANRVLTVLPFEREVYEAVDT